MSSQNEPGETEVFRSMFRIFFAVVTATTVR